MREIFHRQPLSLARSAGWLTGLVLVAGLVSTTVLLAVGAADLLVVQGLSAGVCLVAALLGLLPVWASRRSEPYTVVASCLGSMLLRAAATVGGAVLLVETMDQSRTTIAAWVLGWYALLLAAEMHLLVRSFSQPDSARTKEASGC